MYIIVPQSCTICGGIYMQMKYPGGTVKAGELEVSLATLYTKQSSGHKCCFIRHMQDEMKMTSNIF